jgi:hypothetical protein
MEKTDKESLLNIVAGMLLVPHPETGKPATRDQVRAMIPDAPDDLIDELIVEVEKLLEDPSFRQRLAHHLLKPPSPGG